MFEQTQEDSLTDPLTGLPNRRSMFVHLSRELARAERLKSEVALIVMDIDGFKTINDTYGHNVGDHALREVATTLQAALRPYDLCVRYAGDEFIIVLADWSREEADAKRRELQERIADIELEMRPGKRIEVLVSAGASVFPHDGATYEALLADADQRMYRDKAARGRAVPCRPSRPAYVRRTTFSIASRPAWPRRNPGSRSRLGVSGARRRSARASARRDPPSRRVGRATGGRLPRPQAGARCVRRLRPLGRATRFRSATADRSAHAAVEWTRLLKVLGVLAILFVGHVMSGGKARTAKMFPCRTN